MEIKLVVRGGKHAGTVVPVQLPEFIIGRGEGCQLRPNSERVSRKHCAVVEEEGLAYVRDFNSSNGTFVNDQRVVGKCELKNGDVLKVGNLDFEVQLSVSVGGKKKTKIHSVQEAAARLVQNSADEDIDVSDWISQQETTVDTSPETQVYKPSYAVNAPPARDGDLPRGSGTNERTRMLDPAQSGPKPMGDNSKQAAEEVLKRYMK